MVNRISKGLDLPRPPFLWTLDQVAQLLSLTVDTLKNDHVFLEGVTKGRYTLDLMSAKDIAPPSADQPEWRITENELLRWMARKGFKPRYRALY